MEIDGILNENVRDINAVGLRMISLCSMYFWYCDFYKTSFDISLTSSNGNETYFV